MYEAGQIWECVEGHETTSGIVHRRGDRYAIIAVLGPSPDDDGTIACLVVENGKADEIDLDPETTRENWRLIRDNIGPTEERTRYLKGKLREKKAPNPVREAALEKLRDEVRRHLDERRRRG